MFKKEGFKETTVTEVNFKKLTYNEDRGEVQEDPTDSWIPLVVESLTSIVYMNCNGVLVPYLGYNGKPCRWNDGAIEEIL